VRARLLLASLCALDGCHAPQHVRARCQRPAARLQDALEVEQRSTLLETNKIVNLVQLQRRSLKKRAQLYEEIKASAGVCIAKEFRDKLKKGRNWKGDIEIDHEGQFVYLHVAPNKGAPPEAQLRCLRREALHRRWSCAAKERAWVCRCNLFRLSALHAAAVYQPPCARAQVRAAQSRRPR
jgi:hypothetical protein